jgi:branched-chain amino acid transport system substrate-binding protein
MKILLVCLSALAQFCFAYADEEINIGVVLPLSGHTSNYGTESLKGINLAVENINASGGIRKNKLRLIVRDNAGDPATTSQVVSEMINEHQVLAIIGPITSTNSAAAAAVAQQASTPLILPTATNPYVTEIGEYICRICYTDPFQSKALAEFSRKHLKAERVAVIYEKGSAYSENLSNFYIMRLEDMGGKIVFTGSFEHDSADLPDVIDRAMREKPDLLFAPVYYMEAAEIINRVADLDGAITLLGGDGWESHELFRLAAQKMKSIPVFISSHFSLQYPQQIGSPFVSDFKKTFGNMPNSLSALSFDAVGVLGNAISRSTTMNNRGLQQALISTSNYKGVTGTISINEKRNVVKDIYILKALGDEFILETDISIF